MMGLPACRDVARRLSRELDGPARSGRSLRVRMHLLICAACRRYERQIRWLRASLRRACTTGPTGALPAARRERIRRNLRGHDPL